MTFQLQLSVIQKSLEEIFERMDEDIVALGKSVRGLGATVMSDIDMRRTRELSLRLFVSSWAKDEHQRLHDLQNYIDEKLLETVKQLDILETQATYGVDSI
jgi:DNA integrity scanning protein DisA with diadenylate cyclase activity|tara:strand:+ start:108 stop:410 length:303 start_codon:yes stop_codon:yes gene_type:complete